MSEIGPLYRRLGSSSHCTVPASIMPRGSGTCLSALNSGLTLHYSHASEPRGLFLNAHVTPYWRGTFDLTQLVCSLLLRNPLTVAAVAGFKEVFGKKLCKLYVWFDLNSMLLNRSQLSMGISKTNKHTCYNAQIRNVHPGL